MEEIHSLEQTGSPNSSEEQHAALSEAAIREQLERILASQTFGAADAQKRFLRYAVEQTLAGHRDLIKEYSVGSQVFGRGDSFDPRVDPIVRIQAGKLRSRLVKYYAGEGRHDAVRIDVPKGSYAPVFSIAGLEPETQPADPPAVIAGPTQNNTPGSAFGDHAASPVAAEVSAGIGARPLAFSRWRVAIFILGGVLLAGGLTARMMNLRRELPAASVEPPSVAVLRFANLSDDKDDDIFIEGLTEQVIDSLAQVPGLRIVARSSAFQYTSGTADIRKVGRDLRVGTVVEGSVRRSEGRLRVTTELEDTATGFQLWTASYDRNLNDTLAVQQEISDAIAHTLGVRLAARGILTDGSAGSRGKIDPEAYQDYLEGRYFVAKNTPESVKTAIGYFERAIAKDPSAALEYTGLAGCYAKLPGLTATSAREVIPKIKAAASRALELDSTVGEAHLDLAMAFMYDFDWNRAQREFSKALEMEPGNVAAHHTYGNYLVRTGRLQEALAQNQIGLDLDPVSAYSAEQVARSLYFLRRYDDSIAEFKNALALNVNFGPTRQALASAYFGKGMYDEGLRETLLAQQLQEGDHVTTSQLGYGYAISGKTADARRLLTELIEKANLGAIPPIGVARIYIGLGDKDNAFQWLRKAVDKRSVSLFLLADPVYDPLRSDARFTELLRQMRLKPLP
jgi:TolB-like protein/Tfp pilus assembly protein PilF